MKFRIGARDLSIHLAFLVLLILALVFYRERLYADASYYLLHVINSGFFHIEHGRWILAFSQVIPLLGVYLGLPMQDVLIMYSVGHVLFFYGIFLLCRYRYKDHSAGLLLLLLQTLMLEMGYFTPMFELYYGVALLVLFASVLWYGTYSDRDRLAMVVLTVLILSSHPVAGVLWVFTLLFHGLQYGLRYLRWYGILAGFLVLVLVIRVVTTSEYESDKFWSFLDTFRTMPYGAEYLYDALRFMGRYYIELLLFLVATVGWLIAEGRYRWLAALLFSFAGMLVLIHGAHYGFQHSRYQEQVYFPLTFVVALPYVLLMGQKWDTARMGFWAFAILLVIIKTGGILSEAPVFSQRVNMMESEIACARAAGLQKCVTGEANVSRLSSADPNWSYPVETLLLSAQAGKDSTVTIALDSDIGFAQNRQTLGADDFLMRRWDILPLSWLRPRYFSLPSGPYTSLQSARELTKDLDTLVAGIRIVTPSGDWHMPRSSVAAFQVHLENHSGITLPADTSLRIYLSYHWTRADTMVMWDGLRTPIEMDLTDKGFSQSIDVQSPGSTGIYYLLIDLVAEGRRWFGIDARKEIWVY